MGERAPGGEALRSPSRVLYIQHAGSLGGSMVSLRNTIRGLDRQRYVPVVGMIRPSATLRKIYESEGAEVIDASALVTFEHTTASWARVSRPRTVADLVRTVARWARAGEATLELVRAARAHIVHLNSAVLMPSAAALQRARVPFVWHVREAPVSGYFGWRRRILSSALAEWAGEVLFLTEEERRQWVGGVRGAVVPDFVEPELFEAAGAQRAQARAKLGIDDEDKVVLYVGGIAELKGVRTLLRALAHARSAVPRLRCLMPGSAYYPSNRLPSRVARVLLPLIGSGTQAQLVERDLRRLDLGDVCLRLDFTDDVPAMLGASDLLVFPALEDHFARPIIEAGAAARPVVASRLPILSSLVEDGVTGLLCKPGDDIGLADAIAALLSDPRTAEEMGRTAQTRTRGLFNQRVNCQHIMATYDAILGNRS